MDERKPAYPARLTALLPAAALICAVLMLLPAHSAGRTAAEGFWRPLLRIRDRAAIALGSDAIGNIYLTKERMLRKTEHYDTAAIDAAVSALEAFAAEEQQPVFLLAAPTAAGIYADTLPEQAPHDDERAMLQYTASALSSRVTWIEAYSWLAARRDEAVYFRTDSRWTAYGAFSAYRSAARKLGYNPAGYDQIRISHFCSDYYGDFAQEIRYGSGIYAPDLIDLYTGENASAVSRIVSVSADGVRELPSYFDRSRAAETGNPYDVYALCTEAVLQIETARSTGKGILLLSDSYGAAFLPLLMQHYRSLTAVNLKLAAGTDWRGLLAKAGTDYQQVLVLCSADSLADGTLPDALTAPGQQA